MDSGYHQPLTTPCPLNNNMLQYNTYSPIVPPLSTNRVLGGSKAVYILSHNLDKRLRRPLHACSIHEVSERATRPANEVFGRRCRQRIRNALYCVLRRTCCVRACVRRRLPVIGATAAEKLEGTLHGVDADSFYFSSSTPFPLWLHPYFIHSFCTLLSSFKSC